MGLPCHANGLAAIAVLHIGAGDCYCQDQTQYIDHNVPLTTLGVLWRDVR
jgi:hypothetical protein